MDNVSQGHIEIKDESFINMIAIGFRRFFINNKEITLSSNVMLENIKDLEIVGLGNNSKFITNTNVEVIFLKNCENIIFDNIHLISTLDDGGENRRGCIYTEENLYNVYIKNCYFSNKRGNGIKIDINKGFCSNIIIENCVFKDLGRMGVEFENHTDPIYTNYRYTNVKINNNTFDNLGLKKYGMGVSLSGYGNNVDITNNTFNNCRFCAIENVGCSDSSFINNKIMLDDGIAGTIFSISGLRPMKNLIIEGNKFCKIGNEKIPKSLFQNLHHSKLINNILGSCEFRESSYNEILNNTFKTKEPYILHLELNVNYNKFINNKFDHSLASNKWYCINIVGNAVKNNLFEKVDYNGLTIFNGDISVNSFISKIINNVEISKSGMSNNSIIELKNGLQANKKLKLTLSGFDYGDGYKVSFVKISALFVNSKTNATAYMEGVVGFRVVNSSSQGLLGNTIKINSDRIYVEAWSEAGRKMIITIANTDDSNVYDKCYGQISILTYLSEYVNNKPNCTISYIDK